MTPPGTVLEPFWDQRSSHSAHHCSTLVLGVTSPPGRPAAPSPAPGEAGAARPRAPPLSTQPGPGGARTALRPPSGGRRHCSPHGSHRGLGAGAPRRPQARAPGQGLSRAALATGGPEPGPRAGPGPVPGRDSAAPGGGRTRSAPPLAERPPPSHRPPLGTALPLAKRCSSWPLIGLLLAPAVLGPRILHCDWSSRLSLSYTRYLLAGAAHQSACGLFCPPVSRQRRPRCGGGTGRHKLSLPVFASEILCPLPQLPIC